MASSPAPPVLPTPPTDLSGVCFRNQWFLGAVGGLLSPANIFDYFAGSPFYDPNCNNEQLRRKGMHPLDVSQLKTMVGWEYVLHEAKEPLLYVLKKQKRDSPEKTTVSTVYYVLDGSVYQAPTAHAIITSRVSRALHHLNHAFSGFRSLLTEKPPASGSTAKGSETDTATENKQTSRMDIIIRSALERLPPTPVPKLLQPAVAPTPPQAETKESIQATQNTKKKQEGPVRSSSSKRSVEALKTGLQPSTSQGSNKKTKR